MTKRTLRKFTFNFRGRVIIIVKTKDGCYFLENPCLRILAYGSCQPSYEDAIIKSYSVDRKRIPLTFISYKDLQWLIDNSADLSAGVFERWIDDKLSMIANKDCLDHLAICSQIDLPSLLEMFVDNTTSQLAVVTAIENIALGSNTVATKHTKEWASKLPLYSQGIPNKYQCRQLTSAKDSIARKLLLREGVIA